MQQWFTLSDPAMEEALHDVPLYREFAVLNRDTAIGGAWESGGLSHPEDLTTSLFNHSKMISTKNHQKMIIFQNYFRVVFVIYYS